MLWSSVAGGSLHIIAQRMCKRIVATATANADDAIECASPCVFADAVNHLSQPTCAPTASVNVVVVACYHGRRIPVQGHRRSELHPAGIDKCFLW